MMSAVETNIRIAIIGLLALAALILFPPAPSVYSDHEDGHEGPDEAPEVPFNTADAEPVGDQQQTTSVYFRDDSLTAQEIDYHGLKYTRLYAVAIDPPLESDSSVHLRIKPNPNPDEDTATYGEDYTMALPNAVGTTTTKVLRLPAGASRASFAIWFLPDQKAEGIETVHLELVATQDAPYTVEDEYTSDKYRDVEIVIFDNSTPIPADADPERGITIQPESVTTGTTATVTYTVALASRPDSDVTVKAYLDTIDGAVNIGGADSGEVRISPASLTFTSTNWSTAQTFTLSTHGVAAGEEFPVLHGLESDDPDYDTTYWFQGPVVDEETQIHVTVSVGGL